MAKCEWSEGDEVCTAEQIGGEGKFAKLCKRHSQRMYARESAARKRGGAPVVSKPARAAATKPAPADVPVVELLEMADIVARAMIAVARLGGVERVERLAEVLGSGAAR